MRSLFGALVVVLFFFNRIEISSGMNRKEKPPKTLKLFSEKPESLGRKLEGLNERAERFVDDDSLRNVKPKFDVLRQDPSRLAPIPNMSWSVLRNPSVQQNYEIFDNHHAHDNRRESEYADTASSEPRSEALDSYQSYPPYIDTPRFKLPPEARRSPYHLNQGQHGQHFETPPPGQFGQYYEGLPHHPYYGRPYGPSESNNGQ